MLSVELLDNPACISQLCSLERRTARGGKDTVDHPPAGYDDVINSAAGALHMALADDNHPLHISDEAIQRARAAPRQSVSNDDDKSDKIKKINDALKRKKVRHVFRRNAAGDGYFGRNHHSHRHQGQRQGSRSYRVEDADRRRPRPGQPCEGEEGDTRSVEAMWAYPTAYNANNPLADNWYRPDSWFVMGNELHLTRLLTLVGREVRRMVFRRPPYPERPMACR